MKIGIDLDDTIWKFHEKFFEFYNHNNGTKYKIEDYREYSLENFLNITKENVGELLDSFDNSEFFQEMIFLENFLESFIKLNENHEIYFITARPSKTLKIVLKLMNKFLDENPIVYFVHDSKLNIRKEKVEHCKELGIDIMIDDALHNLEPCSKIGIKGLLINSPWNQRENLSENIIRVSGWNEAIKEIEKYEKRKI